MGADGQVKVRGVDGQEENYEGADRNLLTVCSHPSSTQQEIGTDASTEFGNERSDGKAETATAGWSGWTSELVARWR